MCGIAGFSLRPNVDIDAGMLAALLACEMEHRGRDATGVAFHNPSTRRIEYAKADQKASVFWPSIVDCVPADSRSAIIHTRASTKGDAKDPRNNHPIAVPGVIGVHNGMLTNDDEAFATHKWDRIGQVDSEAIFQVIAHLGADKVGVELRGDASVAWMNVSADPVDDVDIHMCAYGGRPLEYGYLSLSDEKVDSEYPIVGIIFASTESALKKVAQECQLTLLKPSDGFSAKEHSIYTLSSGGVLAIESVAKISRPSYSNQDWSRADGPGKGTATTPPLDPIEVPVVDDEIISARRNGLNRVITTPIFGGSKAVEWVLEDETSGANHQLWFNTELYAWAMYARLTDTAVALTDPSDFYDDHLTDLVI